MASTGLGALGLCATAGPDLVGQGRFAVKGVFWTATHHWLGLAAVEAHWVEQGVIAE